MQLSKWNPFKFTRKKEVQKTEAQKTEAQKAPSPPAQPEAAAQAAITPALPGDWMRNFFQSPMWMDPWRIGAFSGFQDLDRWFGDFSPPAFRPSIDVVDEGKMLRVTCELPGLEDKDVKVTVEDGALTISGEKKLESKTEKEGCYRLERSYGSFKRVLPLPSDVKSEDIEAKMQNGVLTVRIPKAEQARPVEKNIPINGS